MLSKNNLPASAQNIAVPHQGIFTLPEKVLQFGTGVLLRALPDYYIDKANREGVFNGRIVVVKSTPVGSADAFAQQDNLYSLHVRGLQNGKPVQENIVCSAISRVVSAETNWQQILQVAHNADIKLIISNTTEVGILYVEELLSANRTPGSFPAKLLAFLSERFKVFGDQPGFGLVIIPTELVTDNGHLLKEIVLELAAYNGFNRQFIEWISTANYFCNSLVDRIVPGKPDSETNARLNKELGYQDDLRIIAEPYNLWAIEGNQEVADVLEFTRLNKSMVVVPDIKKFRELKLRLLNGTHTLSCAVAVLAGFDTVDAAMNDTVFRRFITSLMINEIIPSIAYPIDADEKAEFAQNVIDRFSNPFIKHQWKSIAVQYSLKLRSRALPLLFQYTALYKTIPTAMALGIAAFIRLMKTECKGELFYGKINGSNYEIFDSQAGFFCDAWKENDQPGVVRAILKNEEIWGADLSAIPGLETRLIIMLNDMEYLGMKALLTANYQQNI